MTEPERTTPTKWHESLAAAIQLLLIVILLTSPWAFVLLVWATK